MTKSKQIRAFKEANPTANPKDIAAVCGVTTAYVYQVLHNANKKAVKAVKAVKGVISGKKKPLGLEASGLALRTGVT